MMRVLICGIDGYIGWPLALHLESEGFEVYGIDNFSRRRNVRNVGAHSALPILSMERRLDVVRKHSGKRIKFLHGDLRKYEDASRAVKESDPHAIVHLGEQPSAPFSMMNCKHATDTQQNNVLGTLNLLFAIRDNAKDAHLVKLGTMGEYGTPNVEIPEGFFDIEYQGRRDRLPFPRQAGSFYHLSKVHDSANIALACKIWGLISTDIMQGVVYGSRTQELADYGLNTRFDFDQVFGTVINRFCAQAVIGYPLTPYGYGGQRRGFIALVDSIQCLTLAIQNPPRMGEYRVFNQLDEVYGVNELAEHVKTVADTMSIDVEIRSIENPRVEAEEHFYEVEHGRLRKLGFRPTRSLDEELGIMMGDLVKFRSRILAKSQVIAPTINWRGQRVAPLVTPERTKAIEAPRQIARSPLV